MKIVADVFNKSVVMDNEAVMVDKWEDIRLPDGVRTIVYDTETKAGFVVWENETLPNWPFNEAMHAIFVAPFESAHRVNKARQEHQKAEAMRLAGEEAAAVKLAEVQAKLAAVKEQAATLARIEAIEAKVGIVHTPTEDREPL